MAIQHFNPTTYHPKATGSTEITQSGGGPKNMPKGTPSTVQKNDGARNLTKRTVHPPAQPSTPGGGSESFTPPGVQKNDPKHL